MNFVTDVTETPIIVRNGPRLLAKISDGFQNYQNHLQQHGKLPQLNYQQLQSLSSQAGVTGRGGAGFEWARKLATVKAQRKAAVLVANIAEGEPGSVKDLALARLRPHQILDGLEATSAALGKVEIRVVLPAARPELAQIFQQASIERPGLNLEFATATDRFVSGQSSAIVELLSGRENLPMVSWQPTAVSGVNHRPTLLANAETWAQIGQLVRLGFSEYAENLAALTATEQTHYEAGTTLLTLVDPGNYRRVVEVWFGTNLATVLPVEWSQLPFIIGGFHGRWVLPEQISNLRVGVAELNRQQTPLGAGILLKATKCPVLITSEIFSYLAAESAGRCGPCKFGMPNVADSLAELTFGANRAESVAAWARYLPGEEPVRILMAALGY